MPNGTPPRVVETLAAALEEFILAVGRGIGEAQTELDRSSIAMQKLIDADPELSQHGAQANWYQVPRAELEIKVALAFQGTEETSPQPPPPRGTRTALVPPRLFVQPVNARYQNQFRFDASAASTMRLTFLPVPPRTSDALQAPPQLTEDQVKTIAAGLLEKEPNTTLPRKDTRVLANFNAASRMWFVLQFAETKGQTTTIAVVEIDDLTGKAVRR